MQVQFARVWKESEVAADLSTALRVVESCDPPEDLRLAVFNVAAQLVTQHVQVQADPRGLVPQMSASISGRRR